MPAELTNTEKPSVEELPVENDTCDRCGHDAERLRDMYYWIRDPMTPYREDDHLYRNPEGPCPACRQRYWDIEEYIRE